MQTQFSRICIGCAARSAACWFSNEESSHALSLSLSCAAVWQAGPRRLACRVLDGPQIGPFGSPQPPACVLTGAAKCFRPVVGSTLNWAGAASATGARQNSGRAPKQKHTQLHSQQNNECVTHKTRVKLSVTGLKPLGLIWIICP